MQDEVAALTKIPKFADVDKSLGVEPLQSMLVAPVDRYRIGLEGVRELFSCPAWRQPVLKGDVEPSPPQHPLLGLASHPGNGEAGIVTSLTKSIHLCPPIKGMKKPRPNCH